MGTKSKHGGRRVGAGRPVGVVVLQATREKIRSARMAEIVDLIAEGKMKGDPKRLAVRLQAATVLLKKTLPDLSATDITSGGKPVVVERTVFKRPPVDSATDGKE